MDRYDSLTKSMQNGVKEKFVQVLFMDVLTGVLFVHI